MNTPPKEQKNPLPEHGGEENVLGAVDTLAKQLEAMEKFMARKFDEISAEIFATSEQYDMAEKGTAQKFGEIMGVISAISYKGDGSTAANSGAELDAVVDITEDATNRILDAAGRINQNIRKDADWADENARKRFTEEIKADIEEIFMACSFQDLTGQRIRKTLENITLIEQRLGSALENMGIKVEVTPDHDTATAKGVDQNEIDAIFSTKKK